MAKATPNLPHCYKTICPVCGNQSEIASDKPSHSLARANRLSSNTQATGDRLWL